MVASPRWNVPWAGSISADRSDFAGESRYDSVDQRPGGLDNDNGGIGMFLSVWRTRLRASVDFPDWVDRGWRRGSTLGEERPGESR